MGVGRTRAEGEVAYERFPLLAVRRSLAAGSLSGGELPSISAATVATDFLCEPDLVAQRISLRALTEADLLPEQTDL